ncbi:MAG: hypothetical protein QOG80_1967 [Pseudonocardiales bacterium]|nr:hypothetical protein [Pseudonocardiales bacterium]
MADLDAVLAELSAECGELDALVSGIDESAWLHETPAPGWTIATQIAHLAWTDDAALLAITAPPAFQVELERALQNIDGFVDEGAFERAARAPDEILASWRAGRATLLDALRAVPDGTKIAWFGPPMSAASMSTARLMETWAHGQDVADALGVTRTPTDRLRSIAHIGVRTRDYAFLINDKPVPADEFRVELTGPHGSVWTWGPDGAAQSVTGPALDFCLLVAQRRNRADLEVKAVGADADAWLDIAQAFAGPPGTGREPTSR